MSERVVGRRTIQMDWICSFCKARNPGLSGSEDESMRCVSCGAQKSTEEYLMPDDTVTAPTVTDPEQLRLASAGPNWTCRHCRNEERATSTTCSTCGSPRTEDQRSQEDPPKPTARVYAHRGNNTSSYVYDPPLQRTPPWLYIGGSALLVILVFWFLAWTFDTHEIDVRVSQTSWHVVEDLKQRTTLHGSGWGMTPSGAFNEVCEQRQHGTENCRPYNCRCHNVPYDCRCTGGDSYECNCRTRERCRSNRNGSASCETVETCSTCTTPRRCDTCMRNQCDTCYDQCPVYENWCEYDYYEWPIIHQDTRSGTNAPVQHPGLQASGPLQRVDTTETYEVVFTNGKERWTQHPRTESEFVGFSIGDRYHAEYNHAGSFRLVRRLSQAHVR